MSGWTSGPGGGARPAWTVVAVAVGAVLGVSLGAFAIVGDDAVVGAARTWSVATWGDDDASGDVDDPVATISEAVARSSSGDTIEVRGGVYRESVRVRGVSVTIRSRDGERAVLDGAEPIDGFRPVDGDWVYDGWTVQFFREPSGGPVSRDRIEAGYPDMVFLDGRPLRQVLERSLVEPGTFFHDTEADRIWIGDDPRGRLVEAARLKWGVLLDDAHGSTLERLTVRRFATEASQMGAIRAYADDVVIDRVVVEQNARMGLSAIGSGIVVRDSRFVDNGYIGVHGDRIDTFVLERSAVIGNNLERFDAFHSGAGMKVTRGRGVTVRESEISRNRGPGIWTDLDTSGVTVVRNLIEANDRAGVEIELSSSVNVLSNVALDNAEAGIWILESQNVQVLHNASVGNRNAIEVEEGPRRDVRNVRVMNNVLGDAAPGSRALLDVNDWTAERSATAMGVTIDSNAYWIPPTAGTEHLSRWARWPQPLAWSTDLGAHRSRTGQGWNSVVDRRETNPFAIDPLALDHRGPDWLPRGAAVTGSAAAELGMDEGDRRRIGPVAPVARVSGG